jgi:hypothetical protein
MGTYGLSRAFAWFVGSFIGWQFLQHKLSRGSQAGQYRY